MKTHLVKIIIFVLLATACKPTGNNTGQSTGSTAAPVQKAAETGGAPASASKTPMSQTDPSATVSGQESWWNDTIFYEIFVRSFKDSNGDGVGDINGLIEKLDYLNDGDPETTTDLGVTGIWLMPIAKSPSYHGYDVVDYYSIDREYGSKEDFLRLIDEAHQRGIRVIVDLVINHTSREHPWFLESMNKNSEYRNWYIWADKEPKYRGPWGEDVWHPAGGSYYYGIFWEGMPDLNLSNPAVTDEIYKITKFWLEDMKVDGFRMDAIRHFVERDSVQENTQETHAWLQGFHQFYKSVDPNAFTVGEAWTQTDQVIDYIGDEVDIAFEFDLAKAFLTASQGPIASAVTSQMKKVLNSYPKGQYGVFLTNHDQDRVMSVLHDEASAKLAATMMLTAPGVPFIYYGEEIGMTGIKPDEDIRRPMQWQGDNKRVGFSSADPWRAPANDYRERNVASQTEDPGSLLSFYRVLIGLRNEHTALQNGEVLLVDTGSPRLYALLRYDDQEAFLILVNVHPKPLTAKQYDLSLETGPFKGPIQAVSVLGQDSPSAPVVNAGGGFDSYIPFSEIPGKTSLILQLKP